MKCDKHPGVEPKCPHCVILEARHVAFDQVIRDFERTAPDQAPVAKKIVARLKQFATHYDIADY